VNIVWNIIYRVQCTLLVCCMRTNTYQSHKNTFLYFFSSKVPLIIPRPPQEHTIESTRTDKRSCRRKVNNIHIVLCGANLPPKLPNEIALHLQS